MERWLERSSFFSHRKSDSCGALSGYFGTEIVIFKKQQSYEEGLILIINVSISDSECILINLYNANIKIKQIDVLSNLFELLREFDTNPKKIHNYGRGFWFTFWPKIGYRGWESYLIEEIFNLTSRI